MNIRHFTLDNRFFQWISKHLHRLAFFCTAVYRHFIKDNGFILASSMVFSTLIAMVPFLAFVTIMLGDLKIIDTGLLKEVINDNIVKKILPASQQNITDYIDHFTQNAATLGWIGLIFFLISSIFLIKKINDTFNLIYKTIPKKGMMARFASYITGMVVGTLFLGIAIALTQPLLDLLAQNNILDDTLISYKMVTGLSPWMLLFFGLMLMYKNIPSAQVQWSSALIASLFGTIAWQISNIVFSWAIDKMFTYEKIYGTLATAIIFLIWVNIMWVIVYLSLEIAYVHQYRPHAFREEKRDIHNPYNRFANTLNILQAIVQGFAVTSKPVNASMINKKLSIPESVLRTILKNLEKTELIVRTADKRPFYIPARALEKITIEEVIASIYGISAEEKAPSFGSINADKILKNAQQLFASETAHYFVKQELKEIQHEK